MSQRDDKTGQFIKGVSGNPNGRGEGNRNKRMTDKELREYLGKRTQNYLQQITKLAVDNFENDPSLSFKCYQALLKADFDMRLSAIKEQVKSDKNKEKVEESLYKAPVIKLN